MINNDTAKSTYTVTDDVTEYPIGFQYMTNPDGTPNLYVWYGDNTELEYGTGYTLSADGLSIVLLSPVEADETLSIAVDEPFIQDSDYVIGRIDPEQIERDFDKSVLRDLELRDYADDINNRLADEVQARTDADAALQAAIDTKQDIIPDLATIRSGAAAGATALQPTDLATVATTGSYNDLSNRPVIPTVGNGLVTIKQGGVVKASFSVNQSTDTAVELEQGGGGSVDTSKVVNADVLPTADASSAGKYYLYTGATTAEYTQNYIYKNVKTATYTGEIFFAYGDGSSVDCSVSDFANFIVSKGGVDPTLVVLGGVTYKGDDLWELTAFNSDGDELCRFSEQTEVFQDAGFTFRGTPTVDAAMTYDCTITEASATYAWTRVDIQPSGDFVLKTGDTMTGALRFIKDGWSGAIGGSGNGVTFYRVSAEGNLVAVGYWSMTGITPSSGDQRKNLGSSWARWLTAYVDKLNNGADIDVPTTGGTMVVATPPSADGTYVLKATVADGVVTTTWVAE